MSEPEINPYEPPREECVEVCDEATEGLRKTVEDFRSQSRGLAVFWIFLGVIAWMSVPINVVLFQLFGLANFVLCTLIAVTISYRRIVSVRISLAILYLLLIADWFVVAWMDWPYLILGAFLIPAIIDSHFVISNSKKIQAAGYSLNVLPNDIK